MTPLDPVGEGLDWRSRLDSITATMRDVSRQSTPQAMVNLYTERIQDFTPSNRMVSLSRRGLEPPRYLIARSSIWKEEVDPWTRRDRLPILEGGLLGDLIYAEKPQIMEDLVVPPNDPAAEHLVGIRSLISIPVFDEGSALNTVVFLSDETAGFERESFPEMVWQTNLFGRATHNLALSAELRRVNEELDREMMSVAEIQRSLLPAILPDIPTLDLAADYRTSRRAGGDYYDIFSLPDGKWGLLIADVSGHGTPAAVIMAITHSLAHSYAGPSSPPSKRLEYVNQHLSTRYTADSGTFVTVFYAVYDPTRRELLYSCAGHNPPRLQRAGHDQLVALDGAGRPPLGVLEHQTYTDSSLTLHPGDQVVFYTDGISEARNGAGEHFGVDGIDRALRECHAGAEAAVKCVLNRADNFTDGAALTDDQTILVAAVKS